MVSVTLCMIVKKGDFPFLNGCLRNVSGAVDEIIIVTDENDAKLGALAKDFGAQVIETGRTDDFSELRNISLNHATKEWILVLDADEILARGDLEKLKGLAQEPAVACAVQQLTYTNDANQTRFVPANNEVTDAYGFRGYFAVPAIRFFRNFLGILFTRRVHEMVDEVVEQRGFGGRVIETDIPIHHLKMLKGTEELKKDEERYFRLSEEEAKESRSPKPHFDMGTILLFTFKDPEKAIRHFKKALELNPAFTEAKLNLAFAYGQQKDYQRALETYKEVAEKEPSYQTFSNIAACCVFLGKNEEAIDWCRKAGGLFPEMKKDSEERIAFIRNARKNDIFL